MSPTKTVRLMANKRTRDATDFNAKVVLEALKGDLMRAQLATKHRLN